MEFGNFGRGPRLLPYVKGTKTSPMVLNRRRIQVCAGAHPPSLRGSTGWLSSTPLGAEASLTFAGIRIGLAGAVPLMPFFGTIKTKPIFKEEKGDHVPTRKVESGDSKSFGGIKFQARFYDSLLMRKIHGVNCGIKRAAVRLCWTFSCHFSVLAEFPP